MHLNIAVGAAFIFLTTVIHAGAMHLALESIRWHSVGRSSLQPIERLIRVGWVVLIMYLASVIEVLVWSALYLGIGAFEEFEKAIYFSIVTFTTLGYGDVVLNSDWRLLGSLEAVNGILMFGWSTAIVFYAVQHVYPRQKAD